MKLEDLLDLPIEALEKMTDQQLTEHLKQYFPETRPEQVQRVRAQKQAPMPVLTPQKKAALAMLQEEGIDLSFMRRKKR